MPLWILNIAGWAWAHKGIAGTILLALFVFGWASIHYLCGESRLDKKIDQQTGKIIGDDLGTNSAEREANQVAVNANKIAVNANALEAHANQVQTEANKLRNSNVSNVSLEKAMRDMCAAFPDTAGCPK